MCILKCCIIILRDVWCARLRTCRRYCITTRAAVDYGGRSKCRRMCSLRSWSSTRWTSRSSASSSRRRVSWSSGERCRRATGSASSGNCAKSRAARCPRAPSPPCQCRRSSCPSSTSARKRSRCSPNDRSASTSPTWTDARDRFRTFEPPHFTNRASTSKPPITPQRANTKRQTLLFDETSVTDPEVLKRAGVENNVSHMQILNYTRFIRKRRLTEKIWWPIAYVRGRPLNLLLMELLADRR